MSKKLLAVAVIAAMSMSTKKIQDLTDHKIFKLFFRVTNKHLPSSIQGLFQLR